MTQLFYASVSLNWRWKIKDLKIMINLYLPVKLDLILCDQVGAP